MSPIEAAGVLGVSPSATRDEVLQAYAARLSEAGADDTRRDALTAARDALLTATSWQLPVPPTSVEPQQRPSEQRQAPTAPQLPQQPPTTPPSQPAQPSPSQQPIFPQPTFAPPAPRHSASPSGPHPGGPYPGGPYPGYPQAVPPQPGPPYAGPAAPGPWYPGPPARRRLSTGAIVGITVGGIAAGLVILLVMVFAITSIGDSTRRLAESGSSSSAPYAPPSDTPSSGPSDGSTDPATEDYDVDGVHVHYVDGWTFELTPTQSCVGATITAGFADSVDGDTLDEWTVTADLKAGVPYELTIPDSASTHQYVGIDSIDCTQT